MRKNAIGDCHIYNNHIDQVNAQLSRKYRVLPRLELPNFSSLDELLQTVTSQYTLENYVPLDSIKADMAI
jgi:thymidylate synthase